MRKGCLKNVLFIIINLIQFHREETLGLLMFILSKLKMITSKLHIKPKLQHVAVLGRLQLFSHYDNIDMSLLIKFSYMKRIELE